MCDNTIYDSIEEARANSKCMEYTLEDFAREFPVNIVYQKTDRPTTDLCENKTLETFIDTKNGTNQKLLHKGQTDE